MSDDDPLAGAEPGASATVEHTVEVDTIEFTPWGSHGHDRQQEWDITDVELIEPEHSEDPPLLEVTFEEQLTKQFPSRVHAHPIDTEATRDGYLEAGRAERQSTSSGLKWGSRIAAATGFLIPAAGSGVFAWWLFQNMELSINGDVVTSPLLIEFGAMYALVLLLSFVIYAFLSADRFGRDGGAV